MSDFNPFGDVSPPEGDPEGQPPGDGQPADQHVEAPQRTYLELDDDVAQRYVRVKVDGEDVEVPLTEALSGYSRTADYTRKTQELAAQRQQAEYALAVQQALQAQPEEALRILARQYGVTFEQSPPLTREQPSPYGDDGYEDNPYADPIERRLAQIERQNQAITSQWEQRQADEQLRASIGGLQQRYQLNDSDVREVVTTALQRGVGPESFDLIYKNIAFDRAMAARQTALAQQQDTAAARQQAAANAQQLVGNGASASMAGTTNAPPSDGRMTISEAFELALRQQGAS
jgi:hypothetical protein